MSLEQESTGKTHDITMDIQSVGGVFFQQVPDMARFAFTAAVSLQLFLIDKASKLTATECLLHVCLVGVTSILQELTRSTDPCGYSPKPLLLTLGTVPLH